MADTFTALWINRLDQFNHTDMDLLITHDQGVIPPKRIPKNFHMDYGDVNSQFLEDIAAEEVVKMVDEWNEANP